MTLLHKSFKHDKRYFYFIPRESIRSLDFLSTAETKRPKYSQVIQHTRVKIEQAAHQLHYRDRKFERAMQAIRKNTSARM